MIHRVIGSLTQWLTDSLSHRLTNSPIHWPTDYWLIHSSLHDLSKFTHSLIHWIMDSWIDALVHWIFVSLIHWFIDSLTSHSLTHGFIVSLVHSVSCAWILSCHFSGISTAIWLFVDAHHFLIYSQFFFWHFGPGMGRPLSCNFIHLFSSIVSFNYIRAVGSNPDSKNRGVIPCSYKATVLKGLYLVPSGKHTKNYGKSPILMGKSTISMAIFNSYVELPEGKWWTAFCCISP